MVQKNQKRNNTFYYFFKEIRLRLYYVSTITISIAFLAFTYSKDYLYLLLKSLNENLVLKTYIITNINEIILCKIKITVSILIITLPILFITQLILFIYNGLYAKEIKKIYQKIKIYFLVTLYLTYKITPTIINKINSLLISDIPYYQSNKFNFDFYIKIDEFLNWNINLILALHLIYFLISLIYIYKLKIYIKINRYYLFLLIFLLISLVTPPNIKTSLLITCSLTAINELLYITIIFLNNWKRLDSNQRSIKQ